MNPVCTQWYIHVDYVLGIKKLFVSANSTDPIFCGEPKLFFLVIAMILEQKYDFWYEKGMFHALTYLL